MFDPWVTCDWFGETQFRSDSMRCDARDVMRFDFIPFAMILLCKYFCTNSNGTKCNMYRIVHCTLVHTHTHTHVHPKKQYCLFKFTFMLNVLTPNLRSIFFCQTIKINFCAYNITQNHEKWMKFLSHKKRTKSLFVISPADQQTHIEPLIMRYDNNQIGRIFQNR